MTKVKVKLRDSHSIFRDAGQGVTIMGDHVFEVQRTSTIHDAIRGGALVLVSTVDEPKIEFVEATLPDEGQGVDTPDEVIEPKRRGRKKKQLDV